MVTKPRSPGNIAFSVSMTQELLVEIDSRAKALGLNRSQYLALLARRDVTEKGAMIIQETSTPKPTGTDAHGAAGSPNRIEKYPTIKRK